LNYSTVSECKLKNGNEGKEEVEAERKGKELEGSECL
jgi:hypothetical protein